MSGSETFSDNSLKKLCMMCKGRDMDSIRRTDGRAVSNFKSPICNSGVASGGLPRPDQAHLTVCVSCSGPVRKVCQLFWLDYSYYLVISDSLPTISCYNMIVYQ